MFVYGLATNRFNTIQLYVKRYFSCCRATAYQRHARPATQTKRTHTHTRDASGKLIQFPQPCNNNCMRIDAWLCVTVRVRVCARMRQALRQFACVIVCMVSSRAVNATVYTQRAPNIIERPVCLCECNRVTRTMPRTKLSVAVALFCVSATELIRRCGTIITLVPPLLTA